MSARNPLTSQYLLLERLSFHIYVIFNILLNILKSLEGTSKLLWLENSWDLSVLLPEPWGCPEQEGKCWAQAVLPRSISALRAGWCQAAGRAAWDKDGRREDEDISTSVLQPSLIQQNQCRKLLSSSFSILSHKINKCLPLRLWV